MASLASWLALSKRWSHLDNAGMWTGHLTTSPPRLRLCCRILFRIAFQLNASRSFLSGGAFGRRRSVLLILLLLADSPRLANHLLPNEVFLMGDLASSNGAEEPLDVIPHLVGDSFHVTLAVLLHCLNFDKLNAKRST